MKTRWTRDFETHGNRWIIAHFPRRYKEMLYIEPFFGEGSVFWSKEPSAAEFINDRSGAVTGLYGKMALSGRNRVWVLTTDPKEMLRLAEGKDVFIFIDPPAQARKNGVLDSCAVDRDETVRRSVAEAELRLIMFRIESRIMHLDAISDPEYIAIALKVCALIDTKGEISKGEHYFRNHFSRAPLTLDDMVHIITETDNITFGWRLSTWQETAFHTYGEDGAYNLKFISADGHFEAVYNKDGELLTADNAPLNMGTFNYGDYQKENMKHLKYDVWPYFEWNNTKEAAAMNKNEEKTTSVPIDKHPQAMARYREYEALLGRECTDE